ncbi:MAG: monovalent cation/H(+) antiporter subunit G [Thermotogota bacterium]
MIGDILFYIGIFFFMVGSIGMLTMKDFYSRVQASGIADTIGIFTILLSFMIKNPDNIAKLVLIALLIIIIEPVISHILAWGASRSDIKVGGNKK